MPTWPPPQSRASRLPPPRRRRRVRPLLWLALLAGLAALAYALVPARFGATGTTAGGDDVLRAQLIATRRQVARLQGQVDALELRVQVMEARSGYRSPLATPPDVTERPPSMP